MKFNKNEIKLIKEVLELGIDTFNKWSNEYHFDHEPEKQEYADKCNECKKLLSKIK